MVLIYFKRKDVFLFNFESLIKQSFVVLSQIKFIILTSLFNTDFRIQVTLFSNN